MKTLTMRNVPLEDLPSAVLVDRVQRGASHSGDNLNALVRELDRRGLVPSVTSPGFVRKPLVPSY